MARIFDVLGAAHRAPEAVRERRGHRDPREAVLSELIDTIQE